MSLKALRKTVNRRKKDTFEVGTVIRWEANGYTYAALKTPPAWVTTARAGNPFVKSFYPDFKDLLEVLGREEVTEVVVSQTWLQISEDEDKDKDQQGWPKAPVYGYHVSASSEDETKDKPKLDRLMSEETQWVERPDEAYQRGPISNSGKTTKEFREELSRSRVRAEREAVREGYQPESTIEEVFFPKPEPYNSGMPRGEEYVDPESDEDPDSYYDKFPGHSGESI